ncbi:hypothetical protein MPTK1_7g09360 [Marchantia polymorpha subsp. ruderalis]|uniref:Uncharacterized protein n=2 Tax=Marchantia polymorpha TaxID=3197 RepID=A0AAF6BXR4_MARPO|nr:hypothetical protein MARPO_0068s0089 [Marchantia polymorpha]BBN16798.1 hypothetical protein Mp_7g09360 [Marchantia polymorpha subsp. ruderalis]|eukprot:PTQ35881.1 hypothetical protein MARPO_0068s0089 [Marchantia polymorpha]
MGRSRPPFEFIDVEKGEGNGRFEDSPIGSIMERWRNRNDNPNPNPAFSNTNHRRNFETGRPTGPGSSGGVLSNAAFRDVNHQNQKRKLPAILEIWRRSSEAPWRCLSVGRKK